MEQLQVGEVAIWRLNHAARGGAGGNPARHHVLAYRVWEVMCKSPTCYMPLHGASRQGGQGKIPLCVRRQGKRGGGYRLPLEERPLSRSGQGAGLADAGTREDPYGVRPVRRVQALRPQGGHPTGQALALLVPLLEEKAACVGLGVRHLAPFNHGCRNRGHRAHHGGL